jgi:uncharacterized protein GlcG (DUF336 family)
MNVSALDAAEINRIASQASTRIGKAMSIAVVDSGGYIVSILRMDGARPLTPKIALSKAYSAAAMQRPTKMLKDWSNSDPVFFSQVATMGMEPIVATLGGVTLKRDGEVIGGLGISGGSPQEDQDIADSVVAELGFEVDFAAWAGAKR